MPLFLPWIIDTAPGASNWGVGQRAGDSITTGSNNIAIGDDALTANTTGSNNVAIGTSAMGDAPSFSVAIGSSALAVGGSQNVAIGYQALIGSNAAGNIAIGYRAGDNIPVASGAALNILIGFGVDAPTSTETGQISIGNLIYGFIPLGGYFGGSTVSDGNVGIGVPTASFPSAGTLGLFFADGTAPSGLASNTAGIYANDVGGTVQMFAINEAGTSYQLTAAPTLEVRDETVSQGSASVLDFVGAGVTAAVAAGVATITIAGGAGASWTTHEADLGSTPTWKGKFTITDASISPASKVIIQQAPGPYTGKGTRADEAEMDPIWCVAEPGSGSATVYWRTMAGSMTSLTPRQQSIFSAANASAVRAEAFTFSESVRGLVKGNVKFNYTVA